MRLRHRLSVAFLSLLMLPTSGLADNLHLIDSHPEGYAIYRSGKPTRADFKQWCRQDA